MIPLNIEDPEVLRRTLLELEKSVPKFDVALSPITELEDSADIVATVAKVNEVIRSINALFAELNTTTKHRV